MKNTRRDSKLSRIEDDQLQLAAIGQRRITVDSDKHQYIKWKTLTLDAFLNFLDEIDLFQKTYDQTVTHIYTHISRAIQQEIKGLLLMHKGLHFKDIRDVHRATWRDIHDVARFLFQPLDLLTFNEQLFKACRPYEVSFRNDNFARTRTDLYHLKGKFKERYDFLWESAKETKNDRAIPSLNFKSGGLFHTWMQLTPRQLRESFQTHLERDKYESLDKFFDAYFLLLDDTNQKMEQVKVLQGRIKETDKRGYANDTYHRREYRNDRRSYPNEDTAKQQLNQLRFTEVDDEYDDQGDRIEDFWEENHSDEEHDFHAVEEHYPRQRNNMTTSRSSKPYSHREESRPDSRVRYSSQSQRSVGLCRRFLYENKCTDSSCPYLHTPQLIREERDKMIQQWQAPRPPSVTPANPITRHRPPPPGRPPDTQPISKQHSFPKGPLNAHLERIESEEENESER